MSYNKYAGLRGSARWRATEPTPLNTPQCKPPILEAIPPHNLLTGNYYEHVNPH